MCEGIVAMNRCSEGGRLRRGAQQAETAELTKQKNNSNNCYLLFPMLQAPRRVISIHLPRRLVLLLFPSPSWGNRGTERLK